MAFLNPRFLISLIARHRVGQKVRKKVWDDMEVKGRSINGIQDQITVQNYPMAPMTFEEQDTLEEVLKERELSKKVFSTAGELTGNVPSLPPKANKAPEEFDERIFGSRSYEFVDVESCMLYSQTEVTTRSQAKQQIILLEEIVRKLKRHFNEKFDELYTFKEERMMQINDWRDSLRSVLHELGTFEEDEMKTLQARLEWTSLENPELDLPALVGKSYKSAF